MPFARLDGRPFVKLAGSAEVRLAGSEFTRLEAIPLVKLELRELVVSPLARFWERLRLELGLRPLERFMLELEVNMGMGAERLGSIPIVMFGTHVVRLGMVEGLQLGRVELGALLATGCFTSPSVLIATTSLLLLMNTAGDERVST